MVRFAVVPVCGVFFAVVVGGGGVFDVLGGGAFVDGGVGGAVGRHVEGAVDQRAAGDEDHECGEDGTSALSFFFAVGERERSEHQDGGDPCTNGGFGKGDVDGIHDHEEAGTQEAKDPAEHCGRKEATDACDGDGKDHEEGQ